MLDTLTAGAVNANDLRRVAETADGLRGKRLGLIVDDKGYVDAIPLENVKAGQQVLLEVETPLVGPGIPGDARTLITFRGITYGPGTDLDTADAVFTSQAAVEKFVLPYYVRFRSGAELQELQDKLFKDKDVIAAVHLPVSVTKAFTEGKISVMKFSPDTKKPTFDLIGGRD
jgi:hypothetical protein